MDRDTERTVANATAVAVCLITAAAFGLAVLVVANVITALAGRTWAA